jgi:hypothetical protein
MTVTLEELFTHVSIELGKALKLDKEEDLKCLQVYLNNALALLKKDIEERSNYTPDMLPYCIVGVETNAAFEEETKSINQKLLQNIFIQPNSYVTGIIENALNVAYTQKLQ